MDLQTYALLNKKIQNISGGIQGKDGKSAYEIATENGFIGTEEEWLNSLQGEQGLPGKDGKDGEKGEKGDNGVFVGDVNEAPESANIVVDDTDEGLFFLEDMNELEEEVEKARTDYFGTEHDDLQERLNSDFDNIHQRVNDSSLLPYEGTNISANNSYYGLIKDLSIKGRTLQNTEGIQSVGEAEATEDGKYKVSVKVYGKNLANTSNFVSTTYINAIPHIINYSSVTFPKTLDNNQRGIGCVIKVKPNTTYTMRFDDVSDYLSCGVGYYSNKEDCNNYGKALGRLTHTMVKKNEMTFTTTEGTNYIVASIIALFSHVSAGNTVVIDKIPNFQIEEGTVATDFELYKEQRIEYLLDEPLRSLPNGVCDEIIDGRLTRRVGKIVLNGSEHWSATGHGGHVTQNTFETTLSIGEGYNDVSKAVHALSNKFTFYLTIRLPPEGGFRITRSNGKDYFLFSPATTLIPHRDLSSWKAWLQANPVTVYYELAEPIITQLEKQNLFSHEGITHIFSDNTLAPKISCKIPSNVPAIVSSLRLENEELQKENIALTEQVELNNIANIETSLEQDARLTMLELGVY